MQGDSLVAVYPISSSKLGTGSQMNSFKTPLGWHCICEKIGDDQPIYMIFESRSPTGRIATVHTDTTDLEEDLVLTRILRLKGCEPGLNYGDDVDSYTRCIYIHGTNEEGLIGRPASHGCIRMKNDDLICLFDRVNIKTFVKISE